MKEFGELAEADVIVAPSEAALDPLSADDLKRTPNTLAEKNLALLKTFSVRPPYGKPKRIHMRFLVSPLELRGNGKVEEIVLVKNVLTAAPDGSLRPKATEITETLKVGMVFRSIGYKGVPLPDVPFDAKAAVIPNKAGRVIDPATGAVRRGDYVVGWIKRGPSGVIGTNKPDSVETVNCLLEDLASLSPLSPPTSGATHREAVEALLAARQVAYVTFEDWQLLDQAEVANGAAMGRPRLKYARIPDMLAAIRERKAKRA